MATTTTADPPAHVELRKAAFGKQLETFDQRFQIRPAESGWIGWETRGRLADHRTTMADLRTWITAQYAQTWGRGMFSSCHVRYDGAVAEHRSQLCRVIRACACESCVPLHEHQRRSGHGPHRFELQRLDDHHQLLTHVSRRSLIVLTPEA